jgi:TM2 domain-containing membrane protein YozV
MGKEHSMDCVNHSGVNATAYCQSCGKALCASCVRNAAGGQILCEPCWTAWHSYQQPFANPNAGTPSPSAAAVLGLIPGVGAMYNGQFIRGLVHVVIFAILVSAAHLYGIFGIFIAAWVIYQSFEAYHTARARRDGLPLPDPLGLNEVGSWINPGTRGQYPGQPGAWPPSQGTAGQGPMGQVPADPGQAGQSAAGAGYQPPYQQSPYQTPYLTPYQGTYTPPAAGTGTTDPGTPLTPPAPPTGWRRKEPIGAIVLIGLGLLFLLGQLDIFSGRLVEFTWPVLLIGLGVWLIVRRLGETQGGSK